MLFPTVVVIVLSAPPLIVYVNVYGAVPSAPVKVITGNEGSFWQISANPAIVAVGKGVTVTVPVACALTQLGAAVSVITTE